MPSIESALFDIRGLDRFAAQDSVIHRRDPRAKVITTLAFIVAVVSFDKYDLSGLMPFFLYPVALIAAGNLPPGYLLGKILAVSPFALAIGAFNPFLDRAIVAEIGPVQLSGGWISYASIHVRFALTVSAALILISTTGFDAVCQALARLKCPKVLTVQFMLLYRYLFVLTEEASRMVKAWTLRSVGRRKMPLRVFGSLAGQLLLRSLDRAQRVHMAMLSRGFDGEFRPIRPMRFGAADLLFVTVWTSYFVVARLYNLPHWLGQAVMGTFQ
ncbi:MAG: cobalt/nickel transport system permease protein [Candidatus Hydrogenedentes bacterium]|nr:cobalt/nickel transport system permease protein [Candidatus Hydrogenedentota bacterium]